MLASGNCIHMYWLALAHFAASGEAVAGQHTLGCISAAKSHRIAVVMQSMHACLHTQNMTCVRDMASHVRCTLHHHTSETRWIGVQCIGYGLGSAGTGSGTIIQVIQILRALR